GRSLCFILEMRNNVTPPDTYSVQASSGGVTDWYQDPRVVHPATPEDIPEPAQEGAAEVMYETLGDLVQRFHDHTQAIPVHLIALTERVAELERDNQRLRGTASVESQGVD
nr:hypothetical protein [Tanacetum cinerariifolium]